MSIEKIAAELRVAIRAFMAYPSSSDESKNALQLIDDLGSVKNLRLLLDELSRLREAERRAKDALEPFARAAGYLTDANGWCDTDEIELCHDDGRRLSTIPLSAFRAAARALSTQVEERE